MSLQYTPSEEEIAALRDSHGVAVHSFPEANADFDELAALVSCLDLVVSVQTAVVHLCGALGRPCWVLVPAVAEWRAKESTQFARQPEAKKRATISSSGSTPPPASKPKTLHDLSQAELEAELRRLTAR